MSRQASSTFVLSSPDAQANDGDDVRVETYEPEDTDLPLWTRRDLVALSAPVGLGLAVIAASWYGASGTRQPSQQVRWVAVSIIGLAVSAVANAAWVLRCRRIIGRSLRTLPAIMGWGGPSSANPPELGQEEIFVAAASSTLYHQPACVFAAGRPVRSGSRDTHQRAGLSPCEVCEP